MEKNTGKTETLNFVLRSLKDSIRVSLTSIGIDGEQKDQIFHTSKPEISVYPDTTFVTAEKLYPLRHLTSAIIDLSQRHTALGRLITAKAITKGQVVLAGPSNTMWLKEIITTLLHTNDICLIDGALSRRSIGSPSITDAMILATGAAVSMNLDTLVRKTDFICRMTQLKTVENNLATKLAVIEKGIYAVQGNEISSLPIPSMLMIEKYKNVLFSCGKRLFISGILTENLLKFILTLKDVSEVELIVTDFTKIFSTALTTDLFIKRGGKLRVVMPTNLIAVTINPFAPSGFAFDSARLHNALAERINVPIYNVKNIL
jgi:hypothetical protein